MLQQKLKQLQAKKQQRGLTLLETMLVIAIIALFAGAILYLYLSVKSDQEVQQETTNITKIIGKVESAYKNSSDFGSADAAKLTKFIANSKGFENVKQGDEMFNTWGGKITVEPGTGRIYSVIYEGVPKAECITLASNVSGQLKAFKINGTDVKTASTAFDPLTAETNCSKDANKLEFGPRGL
jgi:prepilin-type cleavage/methylation N-terminal domain protein